MKTYHRATVSDNNTILRTIGKWHKILSAAEVEVTALMVEDDSGNPALEENGAIVAATIKLQSPIYRALGAGDALMIIDAAAWDRMLESEREALVDQQLTRIGVLREKAEKADPDFVGWDLEADAADADADGAAEDTYCPRRDEASGHECEYESGGDEQHLIVGRFHLRSVRAQRDAAPRGVGDRPIPLDAAGAWVRERLDPERDACEVDAPGCAGGAAPFDSLADVERAVGNRRERAAAWRDA